MTTFLQLNKVEDLPSLVGDHQQAWRLMGACGQSDPDLAFKGDHNKEHEGDAQIRRIVKGVCETCPIKDKCLDHAMVNDERYGIWGGLTSVEREDFRPQWQRLKGREGLKAARRQHTIQVMDPGHQEHYEQRLMKARECRSRLLESPEGWEEHLEVLDLLLNSPFSSCTVLAARMGRKRTWFESRFNEVVERFAANSGVSHG